MKILVLSCDKNEELFDPFRHCIEKYWVDHPEIIYFTDTIINPYYRTICKDHRNMNIWTKCVREALSEIDDNQIIIMMDDLFIRNKVDSARIEYLSSKLRGNIACFNFEKSFDITDLKTDILGFKKRRHNSKYEVSIMCGLWDKNKLLKVLEKDCSPWEIEKLRDNKGFDFYINCWDYIIDWGYITYKPTGLYRGKWMREIIPFFEKEGIVVDFNKKGFYD